mgnify:CR=1 FL=1|tara:strand:- start:3089 stop:3913 length:825 start_codon:yes stop_codon:yes gene_type:complete
MKNDISVVLTVHNKAWLVDKVIDSIIVNTAANLELNIVIDGCTDNSEEVISDTLKKYPGTRTNIFHTPDVFETKANNVGLKASSSEYAVIIQDDMIINEFAWDQRLVRPVLEYSDVFAVTARTAHNWIYNPNSVHEHMKEDLDDCWCDILIHTEHAEKGKISRDTFAIRDSVNRGPLLIKKEVLEKLNYLDEIYAPLEFDEHDLCHRAYRDLGLLAGCYWVDIVSEPHWGSLRCNNGGSPPWHLKAHHKNSKIFWNRHKDLIIGPKHNENRTLK